MRQNLLALFYSALISISSLLLGVVRTKMAAVVVGPAGVGVISQLYNFTTVITTIATLGLSTGLVKCVSEYNEWSQEKLSALRKTVFRGVMFVCLLLTLFALIFAQALSTQLFGTAEYSLYLILALVVLPLSQLTTLTILYLNGLGRIKELSKISIRNGIISTLVTVIAINLFGLTGFFAGSILTILINFAWTYREYKKYEKESLLKDIFHLSPVDWAIVKILGIFGIAALIDGLVLSYSQLFIRDQIIEKVGIEGNGIFQASWAISSQYLGIVLTAMSLFTLPEMSKLKDDHQLVRQTNLTFRLSVMLIVPIIITIFIFRNFVIIMLYSDKFLEAGEVLKYQLVADLFKVMSWSVGMPLVARARAFSYTATNLVFHLSFATGSFIGLKFFGLEVVSIAYLVSYILFFLVTFVIEMKYISLKLDKKNLILLLSSVVAVLAMLIISTQTFLIAVIGSFALLFIWGIVSVEKAELQELAALVKEKWQKFRLSEGTL